MDRLTTKTTRSRVVLKRTSQYDKNGNIFNVIGCMDYCYDKGEDCDKCAIQRAFDRLAAYEDAGLSPEEITAMKADNKRLHDLIDILEGAIKAL